MRPASGITAWSCRVWLVIVAALSVGTDAWARAGNSPLTILAPADREQAPAAVADDGKSLDLLLDAARKEYAAAEKAEAQPPGATADEALERRYLLNELVLSLERHIEFLERTPGAARHASDQESRTRNWQAAATAKPVSILAIDRQRELLEDTKARLRAAKTRENLVDQQVQDGEARLNAAQVVARQLSEKLAGGLPDNQKIRVAWLLDLARLRGRTALASIAEAKAARSQFSAETRELQALLELQQKQLADMDRNRNFPRADLDAVLASLDQQISSFQAKERRLQDSGSHSHEALKQAQQALAEAKEKSPSDSAVLAKLERDVAVRRIQVETDDLAYDVLRQTVEVKGWERNGWQYRWLLLNEEDNGRVRDALDKLDSAIQKLDGWNRYLGSEITRLQQAEASGLPPAGPAAGGKDVDAALRAAYRQRAEILLDGKKVAEGLLTTFRIWVESFHDGGAGRSWRQALDDGWASAVKTFRALWDFELFAAEDTVEADGRRISVSRSITAGKTLGVTLLVVLGAMFSRRTIHVTHRTAARVFGIPESHTATIGRWAHLVIVAVLFLIALYIANIPITVFAFLGGALAIGVGFGTQVILKNLVSGIMLLLERPLRVGDLVEVGSVRGRVTQINIRSSTVLTSDGIEILVPNSTFIESNVTNWTYTTPQVRRSVSVGTSYEAPPAMVEQTLLAVADSHPEVLKEPAPMVLLDDFGADAMQFTLRYWIDYMADADSSKIASDIRFKIIEALAEAGIEIPFPQRVVHLRKE